MSFCIPHVMTQNLSHIEFFRDDYHLSPPDPDRHFSSPAWGAGTVNWSSNTSLRLSQHCGFSPDHPVLVAHPCHGSAHAKSSLNFFASIFLIKCEILGMRTGYLPRSSQPPTQGRIPCFTNDHQTSTSELLAPGLPLSIWLCQQQQKEIVYRAELGNSDPKTNTGPIFGNCCVKVAKTPQFVTSTSKVFGKAFPK